MASIRQANIVFPYRDKLISDKGGGMKIEEEVDGVDGGGVPRPACMPTFAPPMGHRHLSIDSHASRLAMK